MKDFIIQECLKTLKQPEFADKIQIIVNPILDILFTKLNTYIYIAIITIIFILLLLLMNLLMLIYIVRNK
jgi:hypothetical protein